MYPIRVFDSVVRCDLYRVEYIGLIFVHLMTQLLPRQGRFGPLKCGTLNQLSFYCYFLSCPWLIHNHYGIDLLGNIFVILCFYHRRVMFSVLLKAGSYGLNFLVKYNSRYDRSHFQIDNVMFLINF